MHVAEIWRYPVKSMGGERLERCRVDAGGIPGDRAVSVEAPAGKPVTSRSRPRLLVHRATLGADGVPRVHGRPWQDPTVAADVERAAGEGTRLLERHDPGRFDRQPLLVATDGALADLGVDLRRLRPNLVIGGVEGLAERTWPGRRLRAGAVVIELVDLRERCIMTTFDPDTAEQDKGVLLRIHERYQGRFALDARVLSPGELTVGHAVELI